MLLVLRVVQFLCLLSLAGTQRTVSTTNNNGYLNTNNLQNFNNVLNGLGGVNTNTNANYNGNLNGNAANNFNANANVNTNSYNPNQYFNRINNNLNNLNANNNNNLNTYLNRYNDNVNRNLNLNNALSRSPSLSTNRNYNNNLGNNFFNNNNNPATTNVNNNNNNIGFSTAPQTTFNNNIGFSAAPQANVGFSAAPQGSYNPFSDFTASLAQRKEVHAMCSMMPDPNAPYNVTGTVDFVQAVTSLNYPLGLLEVRVRLQGFPVDDTEVDHGMHVHMYGDISQGCNSAGGHYNPLKSVHGARTSPVRHVGDFGNVKEDRQGMVNMVFKDKVASLVGDNSIMGRTLIVHEARDDLGLGGNEGSLRNGNSGSPVACCVIAYAPANNWQGIQNLSIL